jgi:hypothetical protein
MIFFFLSLSVFCLVSIVDKLPSSKLVVADPPKRLESNRGGEKAKGAITC